VLPQALAGKGWIVVDPSPYQYTIQDSYLSMAKKENAEGFFNDGLTFLFKDSTGLQEIRPKHIHFAIRTETREGMESCDLRFYSVAEKQEETSGRLLESEPEQSQEEITRAPTGPNSDYVAVEYSDVAFFRLGYFDYAKLNT